MRAALLLPVLVCGARALSFCDPDDAWTAEWADEFEGGALDESKWSVITGANLGACRSAVCDAEDVYLEDGALVLRSRRSDGGGANFTTGAVWTLGKAAWSHAPAFRLCVAAALPGGGGGGRGQGVWPAHWLMPEDASCDPDEGEPDVLEMVSGDGLAVTTYHWQTTYPAANCSYPDGHLEVTASTPMPDDWGSAYHEYVVERARPRRVRHRRRDGAERVGGRGRPERAALLAHAVPPHPQHGDRRRLAGRARRGDRVPHVPPHRLRARRPRRDARLRVAAARGIAHAGAPLPPGHSARPRLR